MVDGKEEESNTNQIIMSRCGNHHITLLVNKVMFQNIGLYGNRLIMLVIFYPVYVMDMRFL